MSGEPREYPAKVREALRSRCFLPAWTMDPEERSFELSKIFEECIEGASETNEDAQIRGRLENLRPRLEPPRETG